MTAGRQNGFSLIELAVVLVVIGLLVGGGIAALNASSEQARRTQQKEQFETIRVALHGFAMDKGRLPCADTDYPSGSGDIGVENYQPGDSDDRGGCEGADRGALPWVTLGVGRRDAWGNVLYYSVDEDFAAEADDPDDENDPKGSAFTLEDEAYRDIDDSVDDGEAVASGVPAVVVSFGPQGDQFWASGFDCHGAAGFSEDERENCDDDQNFVDAGYRPGDSPDGRFDDMLMWISGFVLKARMVEADKLP